MKKLLMMLTLAIAATAWAETEVIDGLTWTYTIQSNGAKICSAQDWVPAVSPVPQGTLEVPSMLGGYPVVVIGEHAFTDVDSVRIVLPETVEEVERCAFYSSWSYEIVLPSSLKKIGSQAFDCNPNLKYIVIPENVESFVGGFSQCRNFRSLFFKGNAPAYADPGIADNRTTVYVPEGSTGWKTATSTELPDRWLGANIEHWTFFPEIKYKVVFDIGEYGERTGGGELVQYVAWQGSATAPKVSALPQGWEFDHWSCGFETITNSCVVQAVYSTGTGYAYSDVYYTEEKNGMTWSFSVKDGKAKLGVEFDEFGDEVSFVPAVSPAQTRGLIVVPDELGGFPVTTIGEYAFSNVGDQYWVNATKVVLPETVINIENVAFYASYVNIIELPASLKTIGSQAFDDNANLKYLIIPESVESYPAHLGQCLNFVSLYFKGSVPFDFESYNLISLEQRTQCLVQFVADVWDSWNGSPHQGQCDVLAVDASEPVGDILPVLERAQWNFSGWYTERNGGTKVTAATIIEGDITCYAHWTEATIPSDTPIPSGTPILDIENNILVSVDLNGATTVEIPNGVVGIASNAFENCANVELVSIPESVAAIPTATFANCDRLWANWYKTMAKGGDATDSVTLTVTNVVVHYVTASVPSTAVTPAEQTGLVNIIAEVTSGGPVAISSTWTEQYPGFEAKFGSDFTAALTKPTGKRDSAGNAMLVWQDFVAGTDPTKDDDVFTASITFDGDGNPVISYTPELSEAETAKRAYRKFGKVKLNDPDWTEIADGEEDNYNFFKVSVEMK